MATPTCNVLKETSGQEHWRDLDADERRMEILLYYGGVFGYPIRVVLTEASRPLHEVHL